MIKLLANWKQKLLHPDKGHLENPQLTSDLTHRHDYLDREVKQLEVSMLQWLMSGETLNTGPAVHHTHKWIWNGSQIQRDGRRDTNIRGFRRNGQERIFWPWHWWRGKGKKDTDNKMKSWTSSKSKHTVKKTKQQAMVWWKYLPYVCVTEDVYPE